MKNIDYLQVKDYKNLKIRFKDGRIIYIKGKVTAKKVGKILNQQKKLI